MPGKANSGDDADSSSLDRPQFHRHFQANRSLRRRLGGPEVDDLGLEALLHPRRYHVGLPELKAVSVTVKRSTARPAASLRSTTSAVFGIPLPPTCCDGLPPLQWANHPRHSRPSRSDRTDNSAHNPRRRIKAQARRKRPVASEVARAPRALRRGGRGEDHPRRPRRRGRSAHGLDGARSAEARGACTDAGDPVGLDRALQRDGVPHCRHRDSVDRYPWRTLPARRVVDLPLV